MCVDAVEAMGCAARPGPDSSGRTRRGPGCFLATRPGASSARKRSASASYSEAAPTALISMPEFTSVLQSGLGRSVGALRWGGCLGSPNHEGAVGLAEGVRLARVVVRIGAPLPVDHQPVQ